MKKNEVKLRVGALYVRVSTHDQDELSPDAQKRLCLDYAKSNNIIIPGDFIFMESVSGRNAQKRHEFQRMISLAKSPEHPFDVIIVWKYSRFARNQEESIVYKSMLRKDGVEVVSVSEPLVDGPFGSLIERIIEWMDEYYSIRLSGEVMRGMKEKALRQGYQTSPCLGYDAVGGGKPFVINEDEFRIVEFIFDQYDNRNKDETRIARMCNERCWRTKRGNLFDRRAVDRILRNPFYHGAVIWDGIEFDGTHETRLTKDRFDERIKLMDARRRPSKSRSVSVCKHWLSGVLRCSKCGATMAYGGAVSSRTFTCWQYAKGMHSGPAGISVRKAEAAVFDYFDRILAGEEFTYVYKRPAAAKEESKAEALKKEIERIETREQRVKYAYENGIDTLEEYKENRLRLREQRRKLEEELKEMTEEKEEEDSLPAITREEVLGEIRSVNDLLRNPDVSYEEKGVLIRTIVDQIVFDREAGKMYFDIIIS